MTFILIETQYLNQEFKKTIQLLQETGCVKDSLKHGRTKWDENEALSLNVLQSNVEDLLASTSQQEMLPECQVYLKHQLVKFYMAEVLKRTKFVQFKS